MNGTADSGTSPGDANLDMNSESDGGPTDAATDLDVLDGDLPADMKADMQPDSGSGSDAGRDGGADGGQDTGSDVGQDAGSDTGQDMASSGDCISGAVGNRAVRFRWDGNGSGSTAYVRYENNELPDTSRWKAGAYSSNIGYTPVFTDVFLAAGGLDLGGTVFMDIELSTLGLSTVRSATIGILGRSFNTTSPGSFTWQTFSDTGATPSGFVSNSAPYQWYLADATSALPPGNDGTLLRLRAGPPSNNLVVNSVEICFDAD